ncbi:hypothetical protein RRG08_024197 [Elysia crispata]|uniref:Xanthine dehydrogenase n=1 Tax=Elysia crispata TaxID=231223 RepID=A0AAE0YQJ5_9GAST|nr:hypothetical protein RRG08_024197 [Elysia crispata]
MDSSNLLVFFVNGRKVTVANPDPEMTVLHFLRYKLRLTGTKLACGEGGCGACTVMYSRYDHHNDTINVRTKLHPIQRQLAENHGSQCGFCTPGIVMSVYALLRNHPRPTKQQIYEALDGNLCRCTGYRPILDGLYPFTGCKTQCGLGDSCCQSRKGDLDLEPEMPTRETFSLEKERRGACPDEPLLYDPTQELVFPPQLKRHISSTATLDRSISSLDKNLTKQVCDNQNRNFNKKFVNALKHLFTFWVNVSFSGLPFSRRSVSGLVKAENLASKLLSQSLEKHRTIDIQLNPHGFHGKLYAYDQEVSLEKHRRFPWRNICESTAEDINGPSYGPSIE